MAWSAKLISGSGGVQGYNEWELFYNPSTQAAYKLTYNIGIGGDAPKVLYHTPDDGSPVPVRANGRNRLLFLEMHIPPQTSWDNVLNILAPIARLVGGPGSQALRASAGAANTVKVGIKPDGATNTTYFDVLDGFIDTDRAFTQDVSMLNKTAYKITIALTCKPYGYGDAFTLRNDLPSSPHMIEDSNADGLADGLQTAGTAPTNIAPATDRYLTGGRSQFFRVDATNTSGLRTAAVTAAIGTQAVFYVWVTSGTPLVDDILTIELQDGSANILATVNFDPSAPAGYDKTFTGYGGFVWYRYAVAGTNGAAADFIGFIIRRVGNATAISNYYIDNMYLQTGTLTAPAAFDSSSALKNRYDPTSTSAATQQQINYLDIWGVPGDLPALVKITNDYGDVTDSGSLIVAKRDTGHKGALSYPFYFDSSQFTIVGTSWVNVVDATRIGGAYISTTVTLPYFSTIATLDATGYSYMADTPLRVIAVIRSSNTAANFEVRIKSGITTIATTGEHYPQAINTWSMVDMGEIRLAGVLPDISTVANAGLYVEVEGDGTAGAMFLDGLFILPTSELLMTPLTGYSVAPVMYINGYVQEVFSHQVSIGVQLRELAAGSMWYANPANESRYVFISMGDASSGNIEEHLITNTFDTSLTVTPRTSHLLGTA